MNLREQAAALKAAMQAIVDRAKAESRDLTDDEADEIETKATEHDALIERAEKAEKATQRVAALATATGTDEPEHDNGPKALTGGLGDRFIASEAYRSFQKQHPSGVGQGTPVDIKGARVGTLADVGRKDDPGPLVVADAHVAPVRYPTVDLTHPQPLTLLDIITRGQTAGAFEYLQITGVTNNASIVAEATSASGTDAAGGLKPLSDLSTNLADAKVYTYADGYTVTNSLLADAPALATYLNSRLGYNLQYVIEDKILNGVGSGGEPAGILHTSGVQSQAFDTDMFRTVRKAITKITKIGGAVTAVVMSPEDDEEWDLAQDGNERYYSQGPFGSGPGTAWGRPRVVSQRLTQGQIILGDFRTVSLLDREGLSVLAFNQHADYARRNLTYVRAELRAAQAIFDPMLLCVADVSGES